MFKKILVALDHSDMSDRVFAQALALAKAQNASLLLLHILTERDSNGLIEPFPIVPSVYAADYASLNWETYAKEWKAYEEKGLEQLRSYQSQAKSAEVDVELSQNRGSPGSTICEMARVSGSDLIMVGTHSRKGLEALLMGSVSNYISHHANCSVLIVRP